MSEVTAFANILVVGCSFAALVFVIAALIKLADRRLGMWYLMLGAAFVLIATLLNAGYWASYWLYDIGVSSWQPPILHSANSFTSMAALLGTYILSVVGWYAHRGADWDHVAIRIFQGVCAMGAVVALGVWWLH